MPLLDYFHRPLRMRRHWHSFYNAWAANLAAQLNQCLPATYFAEANVQFGIEIDVASFQESESAGCLDPSKHSWTPPEPALTVPFSIAGENVEVLLYNGEEGPILAGAIELVSPANKDRPEHRDAFVSKCETYLQQGIGLVVVDVVTDRKENLHKELLSRLAPDASPVLSDLYTSAYRPIARARQTSLDIWHETLAIGQPLPAMPLWLRGAICLPVELEAAYERTCREQRISNNVA